MEQPFASFRSFVRRGTAVAILGLLCAFGAAGRGAEVATESKAVSQAGSPLTNLQQIASLGTNAVLRRYQASVEGTINYVSPPTRRLYVQSGDSGVQINLTRSVAGFHVGQRVKASGRILEASPLRLGDATAEALGEGQLPEPMHFAAQQLLAGEAPFRYVTVRTVVRDMVADANWLTLLTTSEGWSFEVAILPAGQALPRDWLDAEIEATGLSYPFVNNQGQHSGFRFHVGGTNFIKILSPGVREPFSRPLLTIAEAARLPENWRSRVRIAGTVTVHRPGGAFYLDDGTGVMRVELLHPLTFPGGGEHLEHESQTWLQPGETVEVIGVRHNWYSLTPTLIHAEFRRTGRAAPVRPVEISFRELREGHYPGRLVTVRARLADIRAWNTVNLRSQQLVLRAGDDIFQARWESETAAEWTLTPDTYVRLTGVNDAEGTGRRKGSTFQLLLRSPADVVPIGEPPVWTRPEVYRIAFGAAGAGALAGAWILLQRWQMRRLEISVGERTTDLRDANTQLQHEIGQRRLVEADLRSSEARKAAVLDTALDSIVTIDQHGQILDFNPAAEKAFGYNRCEVLGRTMADLIIPPAQREQHRTGLQRAVQTGADSMIGRRIETSALRRDGEEFPVGLALARIDTETGPVFTAHIQDISERKRAETEMKRALAHEKELGELKSRFVSMVSHEFRTPLSIIMSSAEILDAYLDRLPPEDRAKNLKDIFDATRHMGSMVEEVLLLGRVEAGKMAFKPTPLDLAVFCNHLADEIASATNQRCPIVCTAPHHLPQACADEALLRHIFTNLLENAVKYSPDGSPVEFNVTARGGLAVFTVRDRGIGIPELDARQLFTAFHRGGNVGERPGTGLGMVIAKSCVELHQGQITFQSTEGVGSTFVVTLSLFAPASPRTKSETKTDSPRT